MTFRDILNSIDPEDAIANLSNGDLIKAYRDIKEEYEITEDSYYDNMDPFVYETYHTITAEIVSRDLMDSISDDDEELD